MTRPSGSKELLHFAAHFLGSNGIKHYSECRTDHLADELRRYFDVPAFARYPDLRRLCQRLGISLDRLPTDTGIDGFNFWYEDNPEILLRYGQSLPRLEHSLCHEQREVIENAFKRVDPKYQGLDTDDNRHMNPKSDRFAGALLMPKEESLALLKGLGYDFRLFAEQTGRSLSSVVQRARHLFPSDSAVGPVGALWLFEGDARFIKEGEDIPELYVLRHDAKLRGFSTAKKGGAAANRARELLPAPRITARDYDLAREAVENRCIVGRMHLGFSELGGRNLQVVAEPILAGNVFSKVLITAVTTRSLPRLRQWSRRISASPTSRLDWCPRPQVTSPYETYVLRGKSLVKVPSIA